MNLEDLKDTLKSIENISEVEFIDVNDADADADADKTAVFKFKKGKYNYAGEAFFDKKGSISRVNIILKMGLIHGVSKNKLSQIMADLNWSNDNGCSFIYHEKFSAIIIKTSSKILRNGAYSQREVKNEKFSGYNTMQLSWRIILNDAILSLMKALIDCIKLQKENIEGNETAIS